MSSRTEPIERGEYILSGVSEPLIEEALRRGLSIQLHKPDLNQKLITVIIRASREQYRALRKVPMYPPSKNTTPQPMDEREQLRFGDDVISWHRARISDANLDTVKAVCREHGLSGKVVKFHAEDSWSVINIKSTVRQFKAAQLDWLQRLISNARKPILINSESDIFA